MGVTPPAYRRPMGYRGKVEQQERARAMRASSMTLQDIATELGVAKSSVSLWVRDVPFTPSKRRSGPQRRPHPFHEARLAQIAALNACSTTHRQVMGLVRALLSSDAIPG